jgi:8-oxo-dGTP pyrophosphatase MutT (NUDIX family)
LIAVRPDTGRLDRFFETRPFLAARLNCILPAVNYFLIIRQILDLQKPVSAAAAPPMRFPFSVTRFSPTATMAPMIEQVKGLLRNYRAPVFDPSAGPANSAVIVALFENGGDLWTTFIKRSDTMGLHRGQMGFPGGMSEPGDQGDLLRTALREAEEEIGLLSGDVDIAGTMAVQPTIRTGLLVQPFSGIIPWPYRFTPDPVEIQGIHHARLKDMAREVMGKDNTFGLVPPVYPVDGQPVWGLTARIVGELLEVLKPVVGKG